MFDLDSWQEIWATISMNKTRSVLTGFGVFWGIFMLIVLVGFGFGIEEGAMQSISGFDTNSVFFYSSRTSEAYKGFRKGRWWSMKDRDIEIIRERAQSVDIISPMLWGRQSDNNVVRGLKTGTYDNRGLYPTYYDVNQVEVLVGRTLNDLDIEMKRKVCVIGKEVYETLFDVGEDPLGQTIRLNGIYFQVIGVVSATSNINVGGREDESVVIPYSVMQSTFRGPNEFDFLICTTKKGYTASFLEEEVSAILKEANFISPTDTKGLGAVNLEQEVARIGTMFLGINVLVWFVGIGALMSGVFGISNIMLVTVRERMREIGVKRALGAKPRNIMVQIMSESLVLTTIAGILGFMLGIGVIVVAQQVMTATGAKMGQPHISFNLALLAMLILIVSGMIAGILPTMRALKIRAIEAIQDE